MGVRGRISVAMASTGAGPAISGDEFYDLVHAAREGDRDAVSRLIQQCRDYLLLIANQDLDAGLTAKLGASDVVQQTLLAAYENFQQFRGTTREELSGWLRQILKNDLLNARRYFQSARCRDARREHRLDDSQIFQPSLADDHHTPGTDALVQEQERLLAQAMAKLPENYRRVLSMRNWQEMPFAEIGESLGISADAARKTWSRAIERLAELMAAR